MPEPERCGGSASLAGRQICMGRESGSRRRDADRKCAAICVFSDRCNLP